MEGVLDTNTVTRQELVDYVINKKIRAIRAEMEPIDQKRVSVQKKIDELNELYLAEKNNYSLKWIKANYGKMIEAIKKNIKCEDPIIIPPGAEEDDFTSSPRKDLYFMILDLFMPRWHEALIVFINDSGPSKKRGPSIYASIPTRRPVRPGRPGRPIPTIHPMMGHDRYVDPSDIASVIRVDFSEIESPKSAKLLVNMNSMKDEVKTLQNKWTELNNLIDKTRNDKELVKEAIIEETLGKTPEGQALLEKVNNLPIGQKLIG